MYVVRGYADGAPDRDQLGPVLEIRAVLAKKAEGDEVGIGRLVTPSQPGRGVREPREADPAAARPVRPRLEGRWPGRGTCRRRGGGSGQAARLGGAGREGRAAWSR